MSPTIYTLFSHGRVHVAADNHHLGTVSTYNNPITAVVTRILGLSMDVKFGEEIHTVNKKSYKKLLEGLGTGAAPHKILAKHGGVKNIKSFEVVLKDIDLSKHTTTMRDAIDKKDREELFHLLAHAISRGDTKAALKMIGKGADLDTFYYDREQTKPRVDHLRPAFESAEADLPQEKPFSVTTIHGSPILIAAKLGNDVVVKRLKEFGAELNKVGTEFTLSRKIEEVWRKNTLNVEGRDQDSPLKDKEDEKFSDKIEDSRTFILDDSLHPVSLEPEKKSPPPRGKTLAGRIRGLLRRG